MVSKQYGSIYWCVLSAVILVLSAFAYAQSPETLVRPKEQSGDYVPIPGSEDTDEHRQVLIRENPEIKGLRSQIVEREERIKKTEEEIQGINQELSQIYRKKDSLESELNKLNLTRRKNEAQITVAEDTIYRGQLKIESLDSSIENNEENMKLLHTILIENYQRSNELELHDSDIPIFLNQSLFEILRSIQETEYYSQSLREQLELLEWETSDLEKNKKDVSSERLTLREKQQELEDRQELYALSIHQKKKLVTETKNNEAVYQKLLQERQNQRLGLLQEVAEYESRIEYLRDPSSVPEPRKGLLRIPFDGRGPVTQLFGDTQFARANARKYGRPFHDGIDFGLPVGTKLLSAADGVVVGMGDTDVVPRCESWGQWILIKHPFGLSTLYAHLSLMKVSLGQKVKSGEIIGYSGNTGFSTGPHLHFGVYDSTGIRVVPYEQVSSSPRCRGLSVPVAATEAKFDPKEYLRL